MSAQVCVARIGAAHGVRGAVKLWTFTEDPFAVTRYGPLSTKDGARHFEVAQAREANGFLVATLKGVTSRNEAERLNGLELYIARDKLPATDEDEYYHADLIGLEVVLSDGTPVGRVRAVHDFGAGDTLEIERPTAQAAMVPFTRAVVPVVEIEAGRLVIEPPPGLLADNRAIDGPAMREHA